MQASTSDPPSALAVDSEIPIPSPATVGSSVNGQQQGTNDHGAARRLRGGGGGKVRSARHYIDWPWTASQFTYRTVSSQCSVVSFALVSPHPSSSIPVEFNIVPKNVARVAAIASATSSVSFSPSSFHSY